MNKWKENWTRQNKITAAVCSRLQKKTKHALLLAGSRGFTVYTVINRNAIFANSFLFLQYEFSFPDFIVSCRTW